MNVLSLFDGISCGQLALQRAGVRVDAYYASEIDRHAIKETQANFPDTIQIGDVREVRAKDLSKIDLVIGGSPCTGFSSAGKRLNFEDPRSKLFFEYVRVLGECKPAHFLLENVKMKQEWMDVITNHLKVVPWEINSALVSAQNRRRLYWTDIEGVWQPDDLNITLESILETKDMLNRACVLGRRLNPQGKREDRNKDIKLVQCLEVWEENALKSNCLTTVKKDTVLSALPKGRYLDAFKNDLPFRYFSPTELCRLQTLPDDYFKCSSENQIRKMIGNGWTVDIIAHIFKGLTRRS